MHGWINREDYSKRILWQINFNPKLLEDSFFDFDIEEVKLPGFLGEQIVQRIHKILSTSVVHKIKVNAEFDPEIKRFHFSAVSANNTRFEKIYMPIIAKVADRVISAYKFGDFKDIVIRNELLRNYVVIAKKELPAYRDVDIDELITLPFFD